MAEKTKIAEILVVEDDTDIRNSLEDALALGGFPVKTTSDGREALEYLTTAETLPCLIFLDLFMPIMSGYEFLEHRRKDPRLAKIPIAVVSAASDVSDRFEIDAFIKKPVDLEVLYGLAGRYCKIE